MTPTSTPRSAYLCNLAFIVGLGLLLLNDHVLKATYGNWLTGKLSDVAGLLIFPLFLQFVFGYRKAIWSILITAVGFLFWKSPFSDGFIEMINASGWIRLSRVVDFTDLLAFAIFPLSYWVIRHADQLQLRLYPARQWATAGLTVVSIFAFVATSQEDDIFLADNADAITCCSSTPTLVAHGEGNIFIPNAFTPDGYGINDFFQVVGNPGIAQIDTLRIRSLADNSLIFQATNISDLSPSNGWDGTANDTIVPAQYHFMVQLTTTDNVTDTYEGFVCTLPCAEPAGVAEPLNLSSCVFATQYDPTAGTFNTSTPSGEALDCFE